MKSIICATVLLFIVAQGVQGATKAIGDACDPDADTCTGGVCDTDKCKLDFEGDCSGGNAANCKTGFTCDGDNKCRIGATDSCAGNTDKCVLGAVCSSDSCTCNADAFTASSKKCAARDGKVAGDCKTAEPKCDDSNAECSSSNKCVCKTGFTTKAADATCQSGAVGMIASAVTLMMAAFAGHYVTLS